MKKVCLCLFLLYGALNSASAANIVLPGDTSVFEAEGEVTKRFGVFITVKITNVEDIEEYPQPKTKLNLLYYISKKGPGNKPRGWVPAVEAEVYKVNEDNNTIEFKILQDFSDKLKKEGVDQPVKAGAKLKFRYYAIGF
ncbi:MAG: hypothetical protein H3C64_14610 [Candidatus Kuenenia stuttgartiensis]|nr:hypothetical protein [Candidatus Kuenenia stuttgartiensis]MCZ2443005.1 hypothetical protein [Flavobacteriales bacterium]